MNKHTDITLYAEFNPRYWSLGVQMVLGAAWCVCIALGPFEIGVHS